MLIYEKKVSGVTKLYGTLGDVHSDSDKEIVLADDTGAAINPRPTLTGATYVNGEGAILRLADSQKINIGIKYTENEEEKIKWVIGAPVTNAD